MRIADGGRAGAAIVRFAGRIRSFTFIAARAAAEAAAAAAAAAAAEAATVRLIYLVVRIDWRPDLRVHRIWGLSMGF